MNRSRAHNGRILGKLLTNRQFTTAVNFIYVF
jgi:hypothetical protein